ncbi:hypothetical protein ACQ4PT_065756 [Festuca glaucescens]
MAGDFDLNFTFVSAGWEGSATDARVLRSATNCGFHEFGTGRRRPRNYEELFNHMHAILRNAIERAFGVLKKRFPILKVATSHKIWNQVKIPMAAALLHNIIKALNGDEQWLDDQEDNIPPESFVDLPDGDEGNEQANNQGNNLRDVIAQQMWIDYQRHRN